MVWDNISNYLICYDGQPAVDFSEDDAVLVLHGGDLAAGGVCALDRVGGYGEHFSVGRCGNDAPDGGDGDGGASSQAWRDKSAIMGEANRTVTCANCCSTLGYVSDHGSNT